MKKLILMTLAIFAINIGAQAQERKDQEEKAAERAEMKAMTTEEITGLMVSTDFTFIPSEVSSQASTPILINKNEYMRVRPEGKLHIRMTKPEGVLGGENNMLIFETTAAEITENALSGDRWVMVIKADANDALIITITADINNGFATVLVESNKQEPFTYKGKITAPHIDDSIQY